MTRIVYLGFPTGGISGGQKVILRHAEALATLGFDAIFWTNPSCNVPEWVSHTARVEIGTPFRSDDILVVPSDAPNALKATGPMPQRTVIFCQNHYELAAYGFPGADAHFGPSFLGFFACGRAVAASISRAFPTAPVEFLPCFADERIFRPAPERREGIALVPRKRMFEAQVIRNLFCRLTPRHAGLPWWSIQNIPEAEVAELLGSATLHLSLNRYEGTGMTLLEALASGCVVAGFTGLGSREYTTATNGYWVEEDDCEAAADALAQAADLVRTGGSPLRHMREDAAETARRWSYAGFVTRLEEVWMRLAPDARRSSGAAE